jgi:hypothetical protein
LLARDLTEPVSYLYGNPVNPASRARAMTRLFCRDETNGAFGSEWGSDDIQVNVSANGNPPASTAALALDDRGWLVCA